MVEPRPAIPTVKFVGEYCQWYKSLFSDVRIFKAFKYLHIGCISDLKRKSLPEIAQIAGGVTTRPKPRRGKDWSLLW
jgi:SRSO17 transposase